MDGSKPLPSFDDDYLLWAKAQAAALRARDWDAVDPERVAEEIESLGGSERREMENRLIRLISRKLKLDHGRNREPERQWTLTVLEQQRALDRLFRRMRSLKAEFAGTIIEIYPYARQSALDSFRAFEPEDAGYYESTLPHLCPYTATDILGNQA